MTQPISATEVWRNIPGYEGFYEVSNLGRVRSLCREILGSDGVVQRHRGRFIKGHVKSSGHIEVKLRTGNQSRDRWYVHRLVALAFVGPCPEGMEVCHYDGDPANNELGNLRYGTVSDNRYDSVRHRTHVEARKTHCPRDHPLQFPNLVPSLTKIGCRSCLACSRANGRINYNPSLRPMWKQIADSYYADIMRSAS